MSKMIKSEIIAAMLQSIKGNIYSYNMKNKNFFETIEDRTVEGTVSSVESLVKRTNKVVLARECWKFYRGPGTQGDA
jgi:hypothetical protein